MRKLLIAVVAAISLGSLALACDQRERAADAAAPAASRAGVATASDSGVTSLEDIAPGFDDDALDPLGPRDDGFEGRGATRDADRIGTEGEALEIGDVDPANEPVAVDVPREEPALRARPSGAPERAAPASRPDEQVNFTLGELRSQRAGAVARTGGEVPAGSVVPVRLDQELSASANHPGDPFTATTTQPLLDGAGRVAIPAGAVVRGRVVGVDGADADGQTSMVMLDFESISSGGRSYAMRGTVVDANPERRKRTATRGTAAKVGAGAAAGAILGQIIGKDTESTLIGAAAGAAAGTAIALGTRDVEAVLPSGSAMAIRLDAPLRTQP